MTATGQTLVEIRNLRKRFRRALVLDGIAMDIRRRDRIALIGANGAGKTTLIRCLLGQYVHEGEVLINGLSPRRARREVLRRIAFVPQTPPPLRMPVRDLLRYAAAISATQEKRIHEAAARLGLDVEQLAARPFLRLSGGQKQKLLIAIAMGRDVDMLIMDEPTANLDPAARRILFELLSERLDKAMIISSHRLEEVAMLINRVVEMDRGRIVLDDRVEEAADPALKLSAAITLRCADEAFARAIAQWGFAPADEARRAWRGQVAGPDRLRFLGMMARYAGLIVHFELSEPGRGGQP